MNLKNILSSDQDKNQKEKKPILKKKNDDHKEEGLRKSIIYNVKRRKSFWDFIDERSTKTQTVLIFIISIITTLILSNGWWIFPKIHWALFGGIWLFLPFFTVMTYILTTPECVRLMTYEVQKKQGYTYRVPKKIFRNEFEIEGGSTVHYLIDNEITYICKKIDIENRKIITSWIHGATFIDLHRKELVVESVCQRIIKLLEEHSINLTVPQVKGYNLYQKMIRAMIEEQNRIFTGEEGTDRYKNIDHNKRIDE